MNLLLKNIQQLFNYKYFIVVISFFNFNEKNEKKSGTGI